ncbi:MAG: hypothetical protein FWD68_12415 [Alphaproteobacteria bacterium]|nr:hypothetical protein [Alphaproteobacteria bacterium]
MRELYLRTEAATLEAAIALSKSPDNTMKRLGADILGNNGEWSDNPGGVFTGGTLPRT